MSHTATPWHLADTSRAIRSQGEELVVDCFYPRTERPIEEVRANAELIVKAVNNHAALLEQLILAHRMLLQTDWRDDSEAMTEIEAAITMAQRVARKNSAQL